MSDSPFNLRKLSNSALQEQAKEYLGKHLPEDYDRGYYKVLDSFLADAELSKKVSVFPVGAIGKEKLVAVLNSVQKTASVNAMIDHSVLFVSDETSANKDIIYFVCNLFANNNVCHGFYYNWDEVKFKVADTVPNGLMVLNLKGQNSFPNFSHEYKRLAFVDSGTYYDNKAEFDQRFAHVIENRYSLKEKMGMVGSIAKAYNLALKIDKKDEMFFENIPFAHLKILMGKLCAKLTKDGKKEVAFDDIQDGYYNLFSTRARTDLNMDEMIGIEKVKKMVKRVVNYLEKNKHNRPMMHSVFLGNPGTGKTTMARVLAKEFFKRGIIQKDIFVEASRDMFVAEYVGQTAIRTKALIKQAYGGILFVDEAYMLSPAKDKRDFGFEAISTLVKEMEDHRDKLIVIFAGYTEPTLTMIEANSGLKDRIQFYFDFEDYTENQLYEILQIMVNREGYKIDKDAKPEILAIFAEERKKKDFSNGRFVRNFYEKVKLLQAERTDNFIITKEDVKKYLTEFDNVNKERRRKIGFGGE